MQKIELLSPAGDLERLKYAIMYGADAVYVGGKQFSLRSMASNFTIEDIKEGCAFAHERGAKVYVTCNIVMHECDTKGLLDYLKQLEAAGVDAVIASSPTIITYTKKYTTMEAHVSTQQSVCNSKGIELFKNMGADRVVLARECTMENIEEICSHTNTEIEVFVEGAMCASVSGRCMLSNIMTNRDANRGGCAQSCRWNYEIRRNNEILSKDDFDFSMASKDLNAVDYVSRLIDAGVSSLKVEGRMKSLHYIATIINAYRRAIDEYYATKEIKNIDQYKRDLKRGENRETSHGFFAGDITPNEVIYNHGIATASHDFVGIVESYDKETKNVVMEVRNVFVGNREIEIISPNKAPTRYVIKDIYDKDGNVLEMENHPQTKVSFYLDADIHKFDLIR